ncbi:MAG: tetratricopeptide repeat protein, partial [Bacteroidales bacterium]|nr:tetratricopeptide repeat protein [Bacteroidales bacterium]
MKKLALIIIMLGTLAAPHAFAADRSGETKAERNLIKEGNSLYGEGKYHEALERYERALVLNAESTVALYNKAVTLVQLAGDDNKGTENDPRVAAAQIFQDIARADNSLDLTAKSLYNLGNMAFNDEKYDQAIEMYKGSLRKIPENRKARQNLLLAMQKKQEQEQNQDKQDQQ